MAAACAAVAVVSVSSVLSEYAHRPLIEDSISTSGFLRVNALSDGAVDTMPRLAARDDGVVLSVWQSTTGGSGTIRYARSDNFGATWQADSILPSAAPGAVAVFGADVARAASDGDFATVWSSQDAGTTNPDVFFSRSTDGGITWLPKARMLPQAESAPTSETMARITWMGGNNWVAAWMREQPIPFSKRQDAMVSYSTDDGQTWSTADNLTSAGIYYITELEVAAQGTTGVVSFVYPSGGHGYTVLLSATAVGQPFAHDWSEPTIEYGSSSACFLPGGEVAAIGHSWGSSPSQFSNSLTGSRSRDGVTTWTTQELFNFDGPMETGPWRVDISPQVACDGDGHVVAAWHALLVPENRTGPSSLSDIYIAFGEDGGSTYTRLRMVNADAFSGITDNTLVDIASTTHGRYVVVWQSSAAAGSSEARFASGQMHPVARVRDWMMFE